MVQTTETLPRPARQDSSAPARHRTREKKRAILEAAARVFRRRGLAATGMRDIAAELGMAVGNLYYYFRDREELIAFVQEDALDGLLDLAARVRRLPLSADAKLHLLIAGHVVRVNEGTPGALAHLEADGLGDARRDALRARRDAYERAFRELIEEGAATGVFGPADAALAARLVLGAVNWTVRWFKPEGGKSARQIGREAATLLVRGLLAPGVEAAMPAPEIEAELGV
jgi:TetR/AcrR family transcriptional regulator, cholesterol catabolism regulator